MAFLFLSAAAQKLVDPGPVQEMLLRNDLPSVLVYPAALVNAVAGLCLILGPRVTQWALLLAAYCLVTSWFHWQLRADPWQVTIVVKNWAIAGGLLVLAANGPRRWTIWR